MNTDWLKDAEEICTRCGGRCCDFAQPPISRSCYERLVAAGISPDSFEYRGYRRLQVKNNGECVLSKDGKCSIHSIKPETCRAGPFTFDLKGDMIEIYLKFESLCPIVRLLKEEPEAYARQYEVAVHNIARLVQNLTDDELATICRIEEPETELVALIPRYGHGSHDDRH
ncbi:MAG: Flagellin N-methylase [Methanoregula sp. PtaU1.Bin051]|nr:MAG: Flagellin N-methylase [Methanoregula sp. PtaU1.Bin051]